MAQADILIADERLLPQAVEVYNSIFRPKRELDFLKRRFMGRYNALTLLAALRVSPWIERCSRDFNHVIVDGKAA